MIPRARPHVRGDQNLPELSTFLCTHRLARVQTNQMAQHAHHVQIDPTSGRRAVSVLVIEDDVDTRDQITSVLQNAGYSVATASDGSEALSMLQTIRPEVIFLDVQMPIMDGPHFREAQRRDRDLLEIPTVVMTGDRSAEPMLDIGVEETLRKPIKVRELLAIARQYCQRGS